MGKPKSKEYDEEEDDLINSNHEQEEPIEDDEEDLKYKVHSSGAESIIDKPTIDNFFNTEQLLQEVEKTMKGFTKSNGHWVYKSKPKARDEFINSMMNRLRSVINQQNMVSYITEEDSKVILMEKNYDFIIDVFLEQSIDDDDMESIINIYDHAMQIFLGHVISGFGARTLRQIAASVSYEVDQNKKDDGLLNLNYGKKNILKIGGNS